MIKLTSCQPLGVKNWLKPIISLILVWLIISVVFICSVFIYYGRAWAFIFDDFEYWDSPYNHGWLSSDYAYPVMGYGVGYGYSCTQIDPGAGSRVLVVRSVPSVFNQWQPYMLANYQFRDNEGVTPPKASILSYKIKAPLAIESFNQVRSYLLVKTKAGEWFWLCYLPVEGDGPLNIGIFRPIIAMEKDLPTQARCIGYPLGRQVFDSTWQCVVRDIDEDLNLIEDADFPRELDGIYGIVFSGNIYSLDEIMFSGDESRYKNHHPFIWEPGPQIATLFQPYTLTLYASDPENDDLSFSAWIGGWGIHGISTNDFITPLPDDPDDPLADCTSARAVIRFTPQVLENLMVTVSVSDKYTSDITMFPISIVNYEISNHPPVIERSGAASNWLAYVNEPFSYQFRAFDQDNDKLSFSALIDGLPNYQYGPWQESIIDSHTGLINFTPRFEGMFTVMVTAMDEKGAFSQDRRTLIVSNRGTWLNHPPVRKFNIKSPQLVRAGNLYTAATNFLDPDGEKLYYTSNIGSMTDTGTYSFLTCFPGQYKVRILAYDIHGAYTSIDFILDVQPWWSY